MFAASAEMHHFSLIPDQSKIIENIIESYEYLLKRTQFLRTNYICNSLSRFQILMIIQVWHLPV